MKRHRINIRVSDKVYERLQIEAGGHGSTMTSIIETALDQYFAHEQAGQGDDAILTRLDRLEEIQGEIQSDTRLNTEALGQFVLYWLTRSEPLPEEEREAAHALGQRRFDHFIGQVAQKWARNNGFAARIQKPHRG